MGQWNSLKVSDLKRKSQEELKQELDQAGKVVGVGDYYRHFKNPDNHYRVEFLAIQESTEDVCVGYRAMYGQKLLFTRPLKVFLETVEKDGKKVPRFEKIEMPRHANNKLAIGVTLIDKNGRICLGKRKKFAFIGQYAVPSGHVEVGEPFTDAAIREVFEETGLKISKDQLKLIGVTSYLHDDPYVHYGNVDFVIEDVDSNKVKLMEPEKCEGWEWFSFDELPNNICLPELGTIKLYHHWKKTGELTVN